MKTFRSWWAGVVPNEQAGLLTLAVIFTAIMLFAVGIQVGKIISSFV